MSVVELWSMNRYERVLGAFARRQQVAVELTPEEMSQLMDRVITPSEQSLRTLLRSNKAISVLERLRGNLSRTLGKSPSSRRLTLAFTEQQLLEPLTKRVEGGLWFDLAHGVIAAIGRVRLAEDLEEGHSDSIATEGVSALQRFLNNSLALGDQSELYLRMLTEAKDAATSLEEDPSGVKLVEYSVDRLRKQEDVEGSISQIRPFQYREFVLKGAEWALETYKTIYPKAERLTS